MTYKIIDYNGEEIQGLSYEQELQKKKQGIYRIEKIIKQQGNKSLVKWLGYHDSFNSWVDYKDINKLLSHSPMFTTAWPGFHKFLQVITLDDYHFFHTALSLAFKEKIVFHYVQESA